MGRLVHFEIHASDPERLADFYRALFGWTIAKWEGPMPYWVITTGDPASPGIDGGMVLRQGDPPAAGQPVNAFPCVVDVDDVDADVAKAVGLGAVVALPKMAVPGVGWLAYILDPDRNILGMMQNDPAAA
ncbi:glyoxalase [bacterium]|nr:VOC family protein [Chloroflexi bacterium CFX6]RIL11137.1 MAG: glyoxalase [bacterium]